MTAQRAREEGLGGGVTKAGHECVFHLLFFHLLFLFIYVNKCVVSRSRQAKRDKFVYRSTLDARLIQRPSVSLLVGGQRQTSLPLHWFAKARGLGFDLKV